MSALIDTGSQRSYICQETAKELVKDIIGQGTLRHLLFDGKQSGNIHHNCYKNAVTNLKKYIY